MTSISSAADTGLPSAIPALSRSLPRRSFLSGLTRLSLIGGSVALLGQPSAVAEPVTPELIEAYKTWLALEHRFLSWQMAADPFFIETYRLKDDDQVARSKKIGGYEWYVGDSAKDHDNAYSHAALVMSAVGCDWRDHEKIFNFKRRA